MHRIKTCANLVAAMTLLISSVAAQPQNNTQPEGFWRSRAAKVDTLGAAPKIRIAIWDSGVDISLFPNQVAHNADGLIIQMGYDAFKKRQDTPMAVLPEAILKRQSELNEILRAMDDRDSGVDSPAAKAIAARLKRQTSDEAAEFDDVLGRWSGYVHGTGVADIALAGNPNAELLVARMEWWHGSPPVPCWTRALADREAESIRAQLQFLVANGARVVNMSWGRAERAYVSNLEACAPDMPAPERLKLARYTVKTIRAVLIKGMKSAPNVLFVGASGNAGSTMKTANPATLFVLPNFLLVGAVDRNGAATDWTNTGPEVTLYANGDRVRARLPGGELSFPSGTSMATPVVVNAAARVLAVIPHLTGAELKALLEQTATNNATGQPLLHPRKALAAARKRAGG